MNQQNIQNIKEFLLDTEILSLKNIEKIQDKIFTNGEQDEHNFLNTSVELNLLSPETAEEVLSLMMAIPRIDLNKKALELEVLSILPEPISREKKAIVFEKDGSNISIAITDFQFLDELNEFLIDFKINYYLSNKNDVNKKIIHYQNILKDNLNSTLFSSLQSIPKIQDFALKDATDFRPEYLAEITDSYHTNKFINSLFEYALNSKAEFIYLDCEGETYGIYFRIFSKRYKFMEISTESAASIILKLKKDADLKIDNSDTVQEAQINITLNKEIHDIFLSFIQTNVGVSVAIHLNKKLLFPIPFSDINPVQQEIYFEKTHQQSGLILLSNENHNNINHGLNYTFVSLTEMEAKKNKEIYSLTKIPVEYHIPAVNHIALSKKEKKTLLVSQILKNQPDVLFLDAITKPLLPILMNFIDTSGKKIYLSLEQDVASFLENLIQLDFSPEHIIKNIPYVICHHEFFQLSSLNRKKYNLSSIEKKKIKKYLPKIDLQKIIFYTKKEKKKIFKKPTVVESKKITVRGIFTIQNPIMEVFTRDTKIKKLKITLQKAQKVAILENILTQNLREQIDIKEVLAYL